MTPSTRRRRRAGAGQILGPRYITVLSGRTQGICGSPNDAYNQWRNTIVDYTYWGISKAIDRLPALSGIASVAHLETGDVYLAGFWKCRIIGFP